ncbi:MAG: gamma-glutamylcyclotransferase family protein [Alphaproteobacteria bacterium]
MRHFWYGTLLDPDVRGAVLGAAAARLRPRPATLEGYLRIRAPGGSYPLLVPAAERQATVQGLLVQGITPAMERRLVRYEGHQYAIVEGPVHVAELGVVSARFFVARRPPVSRAPWDLADWQRRHKARFMRALLAG